MQRTLAVRETKHIPLSRGKYIGYQRLYWR